MQPPSQTHEWSYQQLVHVFGSLSPKFKFLVIGVTVVLLAAGISLGHFLVSRDTNKHLPASTSNSLTPKSTGQITNSTAGQTANKSSKPTTTATGTKSTSSKSSTTSVTNKTVAIKSSGTKSDTKNKSGSSGSSGNNSGDNGSGASSNNCSDPVTSGSDPDFTWQASNGYYVGSDAWSGSHGPQSIYVCNYNSWYVETDQPNVQGQIETYPDSQVDLAPAPYSCTMPNCGPVISSLTSVTSDFGISTPSGSNIGYDAAYDTWIDGLNDGDCEEMMVWNQWENDLNGASFVATNQSIGGNTWDIWTFGNPGGGNCGYVGFAMTSQEASGTVDLLSLYNWVIDNHPSWFNCSSSSDCKAGGANPAELSVVEYGVEVAYTNGTQKFGLTNFSLSCKPISCAEGD
jgi:hypothetical protein